MKLASAVTPTEAAVGKEIGNGEVRISRAEKKALSRRRILDSARTVFFRDGFVLANLDEVAQQAGVAKGTLYRYFESKAELYVAVLAADGAVFEQKMRDTLDSSLTAADQIRATGLFYFDHWMRNRQYFQIFWAIENQTIIGELPRDPTRARDQLGEIDGEPVHTHPKRVECSDRMVELRGAQQGLRRNAAPVETDASQVLPLHERGREPELPRPMHRRWVAYWGLDRDYGRRTRREDRGDDR